MLESTGDLVAGKGVDTIFKFFLFDQIRGRYLTVQGLLIYHPLYIKFIVLLFLYQNLAKETYKVYAMYISQGELDVLTG